jgi:hypothetical protein
MSKVWINNKERHINSEKISFATVVGYGLYSLPHFERIAPTVTYRYANQTENTPMQQRSSIRLQDGMQFSVINGKKVSAQPAPDEPVRTSPRITLKPEAILRRNEELRSKGLDWPPHFTEEQKKEEIQRVAELMAPHEARYQVAQALKQPAIAEPDARLKDAYVIINLLFEEMVTAGINSKGRQMAGRLLYSAGYAETVKYLENKIA